MREVLCACQAVDGRVIRYSGAAAGGRGGAEIAPEAGVPQVHRQAVLRLCELGWLFRWVLNQVSVLMAAPRVCRPMGHGPVQRPAAHLHSYLAF